MSAGDPTHSAAWTIVRLGDVLLDIDAGVSPKALERPAEANELGVLKVSAVTWHDFRADENKALPPDFDGTDCPRVGLGDLLLSRANTAELLASPVLVPDDHPNLLLSDKTLRLVPNPTRVEARYLLYALRTWPVRRYFTTHATGTSGSMRNVSQATICACPLPLPPLPQQRRIAEILDKADALRGMRRAALVQLDTLTQSIFLDMFGDPILNTRGWPRKKLCTLGTVDRGVSKHRPRNAPELLGGPHPFVQTGDVANCDGYIREFTSTYSEAGLRQSRMWPAGTLCITIAANIAKTGVLTFDACFPDSVVGFRAEDPATVEFVRGWLSFLQASLEERAPESAQKNINLEILRGLDVPTPGGELQREFASRVAGVEHVKMGCRASLAELDALFASLQHRAFRGEL